MKIEKHRIKTSPIWPGDHLVIVFRVKKWRPVYIYFNLIFARVWLPIELMILDDHVDVIFERGVK